MKTPYHFLTVKAIANSQLHFTANRSLMDFLPTLKASSLRHNVYWITQHLNFAQILNFFIKRLIS